MKIELEIPDDKVDAWLKASLEVGATVRSIDGVEFRRAQGGWSIGGELFMPLIGFEYLHIVLKLGEVRATELWSSHDEDAAANSVSQAIRRAKDALESGVPEIFQHLTTYISGRRNIVYSGSWEWRL